MQGLEGVESVIGIDPARDGVAAAIVAAVTGALVATGQARTTVAGYGELIGWADGHTSGPGRVWVIEGAASYGAGLARVLGERGERVLEFDRPTAPRRRGQAKTDELDAIGIARDVLGRTKQTQPRALGGREAIRLLLTTRDGAVRARTAAINELKALLVASPPRLRDRLRDLTDGRLIDACRDLRPATSQPLDEQALRASLRAVARRIATLRAEIRDHERLLTPLVNGAAPQLLAEPGIGILTAAQILISWSHPGRCRSDAAFASLAGAAPIPASSGHTVRHRLSRGGDRQLNKALQLIAITRARVDPATRAYIARRRAQGKTEREIRRCLKRYIARRVWRLLEHPRPLPIVDGGAAPA